MIELPEGLVARTPTAEDAPRVLELFIACDVADIGEPDSDLDDVVADWRRPGFDLAGDALVAADPEGRIAAQATVWRARDASVMVHPDWRERGVGTRLLEWSESRALAQIAAGVEPGSLGQWALTDGPAEALLLRRGYEPARYVLRMEGPLEEAPPEPRWPPGIGVRGFRPEDAREVHALVQEAFADAWEHEDEAFDEWESLNMAGDAFDPSLWFLAVDGDRVIGTVLCPDYEGIAWIRQLAVRREYRGRGVGKALLLHALGEFHRRGRRKAGLSVESVNRTGAQALYESVGLRTAFGFTKLQKPLG